MVVAANAVTTFLPEFRLLPRSGPPASSAKMLSLLLYCKEHLSVFNNIQALFSAFVSTDPLLSTLSKLFSVKQGYKHASKMFWCQVLTLSTMLSAKYELLRTLCSVDPLFSILYEL